jgi:hypothetical protein
MAARGGVFVKLLERSPEAGGMSVNGKFFGVLRQ